LTKIISHPSKTFTVLAYRAKKAGEKLNFEKFGSVVGKSVILCQLLKN
jgi:hypothetical protein